MVYSSVVLGLDLMDFAPKLMPSSSKSGDSDVARRFMAVRQLVRPMQDSFTAVDKVQIK